MSNNQWDPTNLYNPNTPGPYPSPVAAPQPPRKRRVGRTLAVVLVGAVALIAGLAQCTPNDNATDDFGTPLPNVVTSPSTPTPTRAHSNTPTPKASEPSKPSMTRSQEQAVGAAQNYLSFKAFSRKGLIRQLSSKAGDGYSVADATYAVDHIRVNWNDQAAKAAEEYLKIMNFSRQGLIEQLESDAGDGFTHRQAVYGVSKAGL